MYFYINASALDIEWWFTVSGMSLQAKELCHDVMDKSITQNITLGKIKSTRNGKDVISNNNDDK